MQGKIAIEEHFVTPDLRGTIFSSIGWDEAEWGRMADALLETDDVRLAEMDAAGIDLAVISPAAPCIQDETSALACTARALGAGDAVTGLRRLRADVGPTQGLAALGLRPDDLGEAAEQATAHAPPVPAALSAADVRAVLERAMAPMEAGTPDSRS